MKTISISKDFTKLPGPRYKDEGPNSGEQFREDILEPAFLDAIRAEDRLLVLFDGVEFGYPTSFLEEAFGGLARIHGIDRVQRGLSFEANEEPLLEEEVRSYIAHANDVLPPVKR